jgi:hypothetical protein
MLESQRGHTSEAGLVLYNEDPAPVRSRYWVFGRGSHTLQFPTRGDLRMYQLCKERAIHPSWSTRDIRAMSIRCTIATALGNLLSSWNHGLFAPKPNTTSGLTYPLVGCSKGRIEGDRR